MGLAPCAEAHSGGVTAVAGSGVCVRFLLLLPAQVELLLSDSSETKNSFFLPTYLS